MEAGRLDHGPDRAHGVGQAGVGDTADRGRSGGRADQPEQHPQGRGLAGAVGPEQPGDGTLGHAEAEIVDREQAAEAFGETVDLDGCHGRSSSKGGIEKDGKDAPGRRRRSRGSIPGRLSGVRELAPEAYAG
jgi:hypothetical protein